MKGEVNWTVTHMKTADPRLTSWTWTWTWTGPRPPDSPETSRIFQFEIGSMQNLVYLVVDWSTKQAAWVDPQKDLSEPLALIKKHQLSLQAVWLTHTHADHVAGLAELMGQFPGIPVYLHEKEAFRLKLSPSFQERLHFLHDQEQIALGNQGIRAWHMPGHSAGALSFEIPSDGKAPPFLLTGDTLFIRDCGRTDLPTGSTAQMFESLQRYRQFPAETILLPGHHYREEWWSTLGQEWQESPPFQCRSAAELEALP